MVKIHKDSKLRFLYFNTTKKYIAMYRCECGVEKEIKTWDVKVGATKSCGCYKKKADVERHITHGLSKHPLYSIWKAMIKRCEDVNNKQYPDYGGRGIVVCDEWKNDFIVFYNWAINNGWEKGLHLDKDIKGNMNYSPENCLFISRSENNNSKRNNVLIEYNGEKYTISQLAKKHNLRYSLFRTRVNKFNWSIEKALTTPSRRNKTKNHFVT